MAVERFTGSLCVSSLVPYGTGHELGHSNHMIGMIGQVGEEGLHIEVWEDVLEMRLRLARVGVRYASS